MKNYDLAVCGAENDQKINTKSYDLFENLNLDITPELKSWVESLPNGVMIVLNRVGKFTFLNAANGDTFKI